LLEHVIATHVVELDIEVVVELLTHGPLTLACG
jgi:hypothetical protein